MFKLKFCINSGANIHSTKEREVDMRMELGCETDDEARKTWKNMDEDERNKLIEEWAWNNGLEIYYEDV